SAHISQSTTSGPNLPAFYVTPVTNITPGTSYTATAWASGVDATGTTHISLGWFDASGKWLGTNSSPDLPQGTSSWTQLSLAAPAPPAAAYVQIHLVSANNAGSAWFDDVTFK